MQPHALEAPPKKASVHPIVRFRKVDESCVYTYDELDVGLGVGLGVGLSVGDYQTLRCS